MPTQDTSLHTLQRRRAVGSGRRHPVLPATPSLSWTASIRRPVPHARLANSARAVCG